jgi:hypothetical protein
MAKLKPARRVEIGGRIIGTIQHAGKRQFTFTRFMDAVFTKPRGPYSSGAIAEKHMFAEFVSEQRQSAMDQGRVEAFRIRDTQAERRLREVTDAEATAKEAGVAALAAMSLVEIAEAFAALFQSKGLRGRVYDDEKDNACDTIWKACGATMYGQIPMSDLRQMIKDTGISETLDDPMFDEYRETIIEDAQECAVDHPAIVELKWAARAASESERAECVRRAFYELKNGDGCNGGFVGP